MEVVGSGNGVEGLAFHSSTVSSSVAAVEALLLLQYFQQKSEGRQQLEFMVMN